MAKIISKKTKNKVIEEYLKGISRDKIASDNDIGASTVSAIVKKITQTKQIPDIELLRQVGMLLRKEDLNVSDFAGAIRVKNSLGRIKMNEDQAISLLEELSESCFKKGMTIQETAQLLADIKTKSEMVGIPIENLSSFVDKKREELQSHNETLEMFRGKIDQVLEEYVITMNDLEDYRKKRPVYQETIRSLQEDLGFANRSIDLLWKEGWDWMMKCTRLEYELSISTAEAIELNREMKSRGQKELRPRELTSLVLNVLHHPTNYIDMIIEIRNQVQRYTLHAFDYFHDDSDQVLTYVPEVELGEGREREEAEKWDSDYQELIENVKNPN